jgi:hypothetical protein
MIVLRHGFPELCCTARGVNEPAPKDKRQLPAPGAARFFSSPASRNGKPDSSRFPAAFQPLKKPKLFRAIGPSGPAIRPIPPQARLVAAPGAAARASLRLSSPLAPSVAGNPRGATHPENGKRSRTLPHLRLLVRATTALSLLAATPAANAEETRACAERTRVVQKLQEKFGETLRSLGLHRDDGVVEVYSSDETGTWTILMTRPDGMSCLLAAGQRWEQDARPLAKPGQDA